VQSELCLHQPRYRRKFVLCARKKGFIRLAMQNGAALVPVFCFGESFMMHNLFDWPAIQVRRPNVPRLLLSARTACFEP
jgi:hypothetical protein